MTCPDDHQLSAMLEGLLDDEELCALEAHLDGCPVCMQLVVDLVGGASPDAAAPPRVGRYEVLGHLGAGGQGLVFEAFDPELQRRVALKIVRPDRDPEPARLQREARLLASLSHANILPVFEVGTWGDGLFLVTELGQDSLRSWVTERRPWPEVVEIWLGVGSGLAAAHRAGLVHRDIKPDNVVLHPDGRPLLTDFGLASSAPSREVSGGTPLYLAPELADGAPADGRSDQFALCVSLYETLTGRAPFSGGTIAELAQSARRGPPPRGAGVPARVHAVVARGLAASPDARFPDIEALCAALREARTSRAPSLATLGLGAAVVAAGGLAAAGLAGLVAIGVTGTLVARSPADPAEPLVVAMAEPQPSSSGVLWNLVEPCDLEAAKLELAPCSTDLCASGQRGRVMAVAECYSRAMHCEAFHEWFDRLAEVDPEAPVHMWRASNYSCPPGDHDPEAQLSHFVRFAPMESTRDSESALQIGAETRAWLSSPVIENGHREQLWTLQLSVVRMLAWHGDDAAAEAEAERAIQAFGRVLPGGVLL